MNQPKPPSGPTDKGRESRLAKALRDNLRRRKAGSRPADAPAKPSPPPSDDL
jgi:hypothetical protein